MMVVKIPAAHSAMALSLAMELARVSSGTESPRRVAAAEAALRAALDSSNKVHQAHRPALHASNSVLPAKISSGTIDSISAASAV